MDRAHFLSTHNSTLSLPLPPEVGPVGVAGHVVDDGGDGGHDPLVGAAAVKVGLCEDHWQHALVRLFGRRRGRAEERGFLVLVLREPVTAVQGLSSLQSRRRRKRGRRKEEERRRRKEEERKRRKNKEEERALFVFFFSPRETELRRF